MSAACALASPVPWSLRPYQVAQLRAIAGAWQTEPRTLIVAATGTGKTTTFAEVLRRRRDSGRGRGLVLAHRIELVEQAVARLTAAGLGVHVESGERMAPIHSLTIADPADVVVATVQTLKGRRLERWPVDAFGTIIVDEAHHATAASYRAILDRFAAARILGVTATPDRGDRVALGHVFPHLAHEYNLRQAIEDGFLAPIRALAIDTPSVDLSTVRVTNQEHGRDLSAEDLAKAMRGEAALLEIAGPIAQEIGERQALVFVPSVELAHEVARVLRGKGLRAAALDGTASKEERATVLQSYHRRDVQCLVNCALFTEGFDAPETSMVAIARPTKSRALYAQMVGRGTRLAPGKADCLVLDLRPENAGHSLVCTVDLLAGEDLPDDEREEARRAAMAGEDVLAAVRKGEESAKAKEAKRRRDEAVVTADVRYRRFERDPFAELGIDGEIGSASGPRATFAQLEALKRIFGDLPKTPSRGEASHLMAEITRRRQRGLCTIKQMRQLASRGLRTELTFEEAGQAMNALAAAGWRMTPEIAERWGA